MKCVLVPDKADVRRLRTTFASLKDHDLVKERFEKNIAPMARKPGRSGIWRQLTTALATSGTRSTEGSGMWRLAHERVFPLRLTQVRSWYPKIEKPAEQVFRSYRVRFPLRKAQFVTANYKTLFRDGGIKELDDLIEQLWTLRQSPARQTERACREERRICGEVLQVGLKGIGNKQCRNWLQGVGLLRYEVPLDSRVLKFLKPMMKGIPLEQELLGTAAYYHFIEDAVQALCRKARILPCVVDAMMFLAS
jgi:N-glycosylase/DNA lyase